MVKSLVIVGLSLTSLFSASFAHADWQLDNKHSKVSFISIKKNSIAEAHYFKALTGQLLEQGQFTLEIDLNSVETLIPIRNERMSKFLFEVAKFPAATLNADLSSAVKILKPGLHLLEGKKAELNFHGQTKALNIDVLVTVLENGDMTVSSFTPVIINAADFSVTEGITQLQKLAGLPSIATAVPVTFTLTLKKQ